MTKATFVKVVAIRTIGNALILGSILGLALTFWPLASAEIPYRFSRLKGTIFSVDRPQERTTFGDLLASQSPTILTPKSTDFGIIVEKIGANAPVIANVDASKRGVYEAALRKGVAHAAGTVFPGQAGISYLFAHSTQNFWDVPRYNAVFYLLREIKPGDRIVTFWGGKRYDYITVEVKITEPSDVSFFRLKAEEPILVLQTCHPPGTTWKRLLVVAKMATEAKT